MLQQGAAGQAGVPEAGPQPAAEPSNVVGAGNFGDAPPGVDPAMWLSLDAETAAAIQAAMFAENSDDGGEDEGGARALTSELWTLAPLSALVKVLVRSVIVP